MNNRSLPKICCILNFAPHYRTEVYLKMEKQLGCTFYFGAATKASVKKMDYSLLRSTPKELPYLRLFSNYNWLRGSVSLTFAPFDTYILTGEPFCLSTWMVLLVNRLLGKKTYLWSHGWYGDEGRTKAGVKRLFFKLSDGVLLYGTYAQRLMVESGIPSTKLHVIYNSLSYSKQLKIRDTLKATAIYQEHFKNSAPNIIFIGRVQPQKKLSLLIEALYRTRVQGLQEFNITIIGDGADLEVVKKCVYDYHLEEKVWFYGPCYEEDVNASLIFNADICISPGEVGLTGIHCMMYGTPVITHNKFSEQMPEFEAITPGETGDFFVQNDIDSLVKTIQGWLKIYPIKSTKVIEQCFSVVDQKYNPEVQLQVLMNQLVHPK